MEACAGEQFTNFSPVKPFTNNIILMPEVRENRISSQMFSGPSSVAVPSRRRCKLINNMFYVRVRVS